MRERRRNYIFCIEGNWEARLSGRATVRPVLDLLEANAGVRYIYRDCSTHEELDFLLDKWRQKGYADYRILYLAFHGYPGEILISSGVRVTLEQLGERLCCRTGQRLVYFGACSVLRVDRRRVKRLLRRAGIKAACGYTNDVDWIPSTALDLLALDTLSRFSITERGLAASERRILENARRLTGRLGFRMVTLPPAV